MNFSRSQRKLCLRTLCFWDRGSKFKVLLPKTSPQAAEIFSARMMSKTSKKSDRDQRESALIRVYFATLFIIDGTSADCESFAASSRKLTSKRDSPALPVGEHLSSHLCASPKLKLEPIPLGPHSSKHVIVHDSTFRSDVARTLDVVVGSFELTETFSFHRNLQSSPSERRIRIRTQRPLRKHEHWPQLGQASCHHSCAVSRSPLSEAAV